MIRDIERLLQECVAGLDAGLTPEECLSAWPARRAELEPLLRQAMMLRVAYASTPSAEFKLRAREKLMFVAGREARQALEAEPDEVFVQRTRQRLRNVAGAAAQESLRAVPPPRLAFWVNARRRLLEAASARPAPAPRSPVLVFRTGLSAAVLVLAVAVAGLAYFTVQTPKPSVSAELASIESQLQEVEAQSNAGNPVPADKLVDLTKRTTTVIDKLDSAPSTASYDKAQELIDRQKSLVQQAVAEAPASPPPALQQAQQQLSQASDRLQAARAPDTFTPTSAQAQPTLPPNNTAVPPTVTAAAPTAVTAASSAPQATPATAASPGPVGPNAVRLRVAAGDTSFGTTWLEVATERLGFLIPSTWRVSGINFDSNGVGQMEGSRLTVSSPAGAIVANVTTGEILAIVGESSSIPLRTKTGARISAPDLVTLTGENAGLLSHMLDSVVFVAPTPTPSPSATPTSTSTPLAPSVTPSR